jgi:hypothetical protein
MIKTNENSILIKVTIMKKYPPTQTKAKKGWPFLINWCLPNCHYFSKSNLKRDYSSEKMPPPQTVAIHRVMAVSVK